MNGQFSKMNFEIIAETDDPELFYGVLYFLFQQCYSKTFLLTVAEKFTALLSSWISEGCSHTQNKCKLGLNKNQEFILSEFFHSLVAFFTLLASKAFKTNIHGGPFCWWISSMVHLFGLEHVCPCVISRISCKDYNTSICLSWGMKWIVKWLIHPITTTKTMIIQAGCHV